MGLIILIAIAFLFGLATTVYLSLRSPEVTVPEVVGKDRFEAERILGNADLNFRVRATRPSNQVKADTVLFQLPRAGEVVKTGQTVAMDISRAAKEGEASEAVVNDKKASEEKALENRNTNTLEPAKNDNENKPKRNKNANKNANVNSNANASRARTVTNTASANSSGAGASSNASPSRTVNQNDNRPPPAPKPAPTGQNNNREKR
ncbi:MAG: PASTA domain-containing protein [Pyrinomonadaceae bacterium]|nr:PASTA domain-containing protein [Pyrinomonadaceae bacterium]